MISGDFRKTRAYKFCGYSFYYLLVLFIIYLSVISIYYSQYSHDLDGMDGFFWFIYFILGLGIHWLISFIIFLITSIIAKYTKDKYINSQISKVADIGYCLMGLWIFIFFGLLCNYILMMMLSTIFSYVGRIY